MIVIKIDMKDFKKIPAFLIKEHNCTDREVLSDATRLTFAYLPHFQPLRPL